MKRIFNQIGRTLIGVGALILAGRAYYRRQTAISAPRGIQVSESVPIGGIHQVLQIRGQNVTNPVILWLHGGPGMSNPGLTYAYQPYLEEDYTVCYWVQRGSGRTYYENNQTAPALSPERLEADITEIIQYLCRRFNQERIILVGHSWGSQLGANYALKHPERLTAYIGVSQIIDMIRGKYLILDMAEHAARSHGDTEAVANYQLGKEKVLSALETRFISAANFLKVEQIAGEYLSHMPPKALIRNTWHFIASPDLTLADWRWYWLVATDFDRYTAIQEPLMIASNRFELFADDRYDVPVLFICGENDWNAPVQQVEEYAQTIQAPHKALAIIENSGHSPYLDHPYEFAEIILDWLAEVTH